jgi:Zn-dependent protease
MQNFPIVEFLAWYLAFLFSTTAHEASHALAALKLGDDTAHRGGQVSLDPTPHIRREPFGMVLFPLISFVVYGWMLGWASAPYDPFWAQRHPKRAALMALAGPLSNLLLALAAAAAMHIGVRAGFFAPGAGGFTGWVQSANGMDHVAMLVSVFYSLNLILFLFNLLPLPPLDGSSVLVLVLPDSVIDKYNETINSPVYTIIGMVVAWNIFDRVFLFFANPINHLLLPGF